jgi:ribulose kinase
MGSFDATCSLAVADSSGTPMSVTPGAWGASADCFNIVLWADHRAHEEAKIINATDSSVLKYVGGIVSFLHQFQQPGNIRADVSRDGNAQG